ncbi:uncharacterized protein LJ264_012931 [Porphyrio hochstetteri]
MQPCKPVKSCGLAATEAQLQPPHHGSAESQYTSAWLQVPSVPRKVSLSRRTSAPIRNVASSRTSKGTLPWCMVLTAETYPPRQVMCRKDVPKADKATQTPSSCKVLWKEWQPEDNKKKSSNSQDQLWWQASRASSATESCPQALQHRTSSPAKEAVTPQDRKSMSSQCMNQHEKGEEQDEAELEGVDPQGNFPRGGFQRERTPCNPSHRHGSCSSTLFLKVLKCSLFLEPINTASPFVN